MGVKKYIHSNICVLWLPAGTVSVTQICVDVPSRVAGGQGFFIGDASFGSWDLSVRIFQRLRG